MISSERRIHLNFHQSHQLQDNPSESTSKLFAVKSPIPCAPQPSPKRSITSTSILRESSSSPIPRWPWALVTLTPMQSSQARVYWCSVWRASLRDPVRASRGSFGVILRVSSDGRESLRRGAEEYSAQAINISRRLSRRMTANRLGLL